MAQIKVIPLGAGQDVGRSCVLISIGGKNVMFDCGMHMGFNDERRFPDFSYISRSGKFTEAIDCVIISHFHLDHCGALPFFTEICGYDGPIYMTYPTKGVHRNCISDLFQAIVPILLEDYRKITTERKGETNFFTSDNVKDCMKKVTAVNLNETIRVDEDLEIRAYYAGHVLGAAMFYVKSGPLSVVYTGDYNMTPDRHLGAATIDAKLRPTLLITETTYATTIRGSKRMREGNFLKKVHATVNQGGKVLIPVFALGRAQELCILLETYWERMGLNVPIYFSPEKANLYYELFILWTNQKIKDTFVKQNMFDFKHIKPFVNSGLDRPGPMVLLATPGMLHAGTSLEAFKKWCGSEKNMCILPGFCVNGTVGRKVLEGQKNIEIDKNIKLTVRCAIESLSFSAHADSKGILQLIQQCEPQNVLLVHGEAKNMQILKEKIIADFRIPVFSPANGEIVSINAILPIRADLSTLLLKQQFYNQKNILKSEKREEGEIERKVFLHKDVPVEGYIVIDERTANVRIIDESELSAELGVSLVSPSKPVPLSPQKQQHYSKSPEHPVSVKREEKANISDMEPERKKTRITTNTSVTATNNNSNSMDIAMSVATKNGATVNTNNGNTNSSASDVSNTIGEK